MKSYGLMALAAIALTSCSTMTQTAKTAGVESQLLSATVADMKVGNRVSAEIMVDKSLRRGGMTNIRHAVEAEALEKAGNADVLLEPQYVVEKKSGLFGSKVTKISVSGRPATYQNFRHFNDSVWSNPVFRGCVAGQLYAAGHGRKAKAFLAPKASRERDEYAVRPRRFTGIVNLFGGFNMPHVSVVDNYGDDEGYTEYSIGGGASIGLGYQFTPQIYAGVGVEANYGAELDKLVYPIYVQGRYYLKPTRRSWFIDLKLGTFAGNNTYYEETKGRYYVSPSIGYTFGRFELALQYQVQGVTNDEDSRYIEKEKLTNHDINISFGIRL